MAQIPHPDSNPIKQILLEIHHSSIEIKSIRPMIPHIGATTLNKNNAPAIPNMLKCIYEYIHTLLGVKVHKNRVAGANL